MNEKKDAYGLIDETEDRIVERYIEQQRKEYRDEWRQYVSEDMTREEINFYISAIF